MSKYSYIYRDAPDSTAYASLLYGAWLLELRSHILSYLANETPVKYHHNIAHDGSVSLLLSFLQMDGMVWPGMGAE